MRAVLLALLTLFILPLATAAQQADRPNTILVLDGSGSMWGQIDGVNKIVIAREVIAEMLAEMPDEQSLGLTVYGHRQRGSCTDIETIVAPAPFTQDAILQAVNAINPRGRTPMTDAVIAAAQSLRHTEEAATVILVSDGIENCNPDPCAIAAELEASGVAFTAHVIGFDVASEPEARAQMQCIADNTGGQFLTADNASELSSALQQVVQAPTPQMVQLQAVLTPSGLPPTRPVTWTILAADGTVLSDGTPGAAITTQLVAGTYIARAIRQEPTGPAGYQTPFSVIEDGLAPVIVPMPEIVETVPVSFTARVAPDMTPPVSPLNWTLFDANGTALLGPVQAPGGNVSLLPGEYRIVVERVNQGTTHEARFTVAANTPQEVIVPLPALLVDVTFVARIGDVGGVTITDPVVWEVTPLDAATDLAQTNPSSTQLGRGAYRVTGYWTVAEIEQSVDFVVVDQPREIVLVFEAPLPVATITAPASAVAGTTIEVGWTGPAEDLDYIGIGPVGATGAALYQNYTYTRDGNPLSLLVPMIEGQYQITYIRNEGRASLATAIIDVTPVTATLTTAPTATAGSTVEVGWTGPNYNLDYIAIGRAGATGSAEYENYTYTRDGNPLDLLVPTTPGQYLIRYFANQDRTMLAEVPITVTEVQATLTAPTNATAASTIEVAWTGPDNDLDYIAIGRVGATNSDRWENYTYTRDGSPLSLLVPVEPGEYMIRYFLNQDRTAIAEAPITVSAVAASITAPASATGGSTIEVGWTGPDNNLDYIAIGRVGATNSDQWENYTYTRDGSPLSLLVPVEPGEYLIQYFLNQDRVSIAEAPITVSAVQASITAPSSAVAGATIEVGWTGPNENLDYIGIGRAGAANSDRWENYSYTRDGNPALVQVPMTPGSYVIQYFLNQDRTSIASAPLTVSAVTATLTAPASAVAGSTISVGWVGPNYNQDYIAIGRVGATNSDRWENYTYSRNGNPTELLMPSQPGDYVIRYFANQDRTVIGEVPIRVTPVSASLIAPAAAPAGSTIAVTWTGPNYNGDRIGIGRVGAANSDRWEQWAYTRNGSPTQLQLPQTPGAYVIQYFLGQDQTAIAEVPITLQ